VGDIIIGQTDTPATNHHRNRRAAQPAATTVAKPADPKPASNGAKWFSVPNRNVTLSKQDNKLVLVIDMDAESNVQTRREVPYIAKLDDRTKLTLDGVEYYIGLWLTEVTARQSSNNISL